VSRLFRKRNVTKVGEKSKLTDIDLILSRGVTGQVFPGAAAAVVRDSGQRTDLFTAGSITPGGAGVSPDTVYDIASLTKPFTATAFMRLWAEGKIGPSEKAQKYIPEWSIPGADAVLLEHLLAHESGLPDWLPFYEEVPAVERATEAGKKRIIQTAMFTPFEAPAGSRMIYSDTGFILLGFCMERAADMDLDEIIRTMVTRPLGLKNTKFLPVKGNANIKDTGSSSAVAPTELCPWRQKMMLGEVHDENAWTMGGVAAHAGLFSTIRDMALFSSVIMKTLKGDSSLFDAEILLKSTARRPLGRTLGWDTPEPEGSSAGPHASISTFGHLGFTGCSLWIDPAKHVSSILLSNRIHPTRKNESIREFRPGFHSAAYVDGQDT